MELNPVFARRLYLALLVEQLDRPNVPKLIEITGWPRRTIQDVLKALPGFGIELAFIQDGKRHNDGYYQLSDWGPFDVHWLNRKKGILSLPSRVNKKTALVRFFMSVFIGSSRHCLLRSQTSKSLAGYKVKPYWLPEPPLGYAVGSAHLGSNPCH